MQAGWKFTVASAAVLVWLVAGGCGSDKGQQEASQPAAGGGQAPQGRSPGEEGPPAGPAATSRPAEVAPEDSRPVVLIQTSLGDITVELDDKKAPLTVDNFLGYVEKGFYDNTIFHQVFPGAVIVGGMYTPELVEKQAGPPVRNEAHNGLKNLRGTIAMARQYNVIDSATCQFFINVRDNPNYDHKDQASETYNTPEDYGYCVFGKVIAGMDVVDRIASVPVQDTANFERIPVETVLIKSIRRVR